VYKRQGGGNGIPPGGGAIPGGKPKGIAATPAWVPPGNMGFALACPSAAYEEVMLSITDCAFSCPISVPLCQSHLFLQDCIASRTLVVVDNVS